MIIHNVSTKTITLRDSQQNEYIVPSYGDLTIDDSAWNDNEFRRWVRMRLRDIALIPNVSSEGLAPSDASYVTLQPSGDLTDETLLSSLFSSGALSIRPPAGKAGSLYYIIDSGAQRIQRDTGTDWEDWVPHWNEVTGKPSGFTPASHHTSHETGGSDALSGNLDATARHTISKDGSTVAARRIINFVTSPSVTYNIADNPGAERVDVTLTSTPATVAAHQATHQSGGSDALTGSLDANARVEVDLGGSLVGKRRKLNFIAGSNATVTATEDAGNEKIDITFGQSAAAATGAPVDAWYLTGRSETGLSAEIVLGTGVIMMGTLAARPAASLAGRLYYVTDSGLQRWTRDNGASWDDTPIHWNQILGTPAIPATTLSYITYNSEGTLTNEKVLGNDIITRGTAASRPAAGLAGRLFYITDNGSQRQTRDNGSVWEDQSPHWNFIQGVPTTFIPSLHQATHQSGGTDALTGNVDANARVSVKKNTGSTVGPRRTINFIEGTNVTLTIADDPGNERINVTVNASSAVPGQIGMPFNVAVALGGGF